MIRHIIAAVVTSGVTVCGAGYAAAPQTETGLAGNRPVSRSDDSGWAQADDSGTAAKSCNHGHSGDVAADHFLVSEADVERTVVNGSRSGDIWSSTYGKKIDRHRSVTMWPGAGDYGEWGKVK